MNYAESGAVLRVPYPPITAPEGTISPAAADGLRGLAFGRRGALTALCAYLRRSGKAGPWAALAEGQYGQLMRLCALMRACGMDPLPFAPLPSGGIGWWSGKSADLREGADENALLRIEQAQQAGWRQLMRELPAVLVPHAERMLADCAQRIRLLQPL